MTLIIFKSIKTLRLVINAEWINSGYQKNLIEFNLKNYINGI